MMKATQLVFREKRQCSVEEFEVPDAPAAGQVLVKSLVSLISPGTEISMFNKSHSGFPDPSNGYAKYPFHPGYSTCGKVVAVGEGVTSIKAGDTVLTRGQHSSYQLENEGGVMLAPANVSPEHVPFAVLASISMNGIRHSGIKLGSATAVVGQGMIGLLGLHLAKAQGANPLIGVDLSDKRLELSKKMGADATINPNKQDLIEAITEITGGKMLTNIVESTGVSGLIPTLLKPLRQGGVLFLLGGAHGKVEVDFYGTVIRKNLSIIGGHESGAASSEDYHFPWTNRANMVFAMDLMSSGKLDVGCFITHRGGPEDAERMYIDSEKDPENHLGMLIEWPA